MLTGAAPRPGPYSQGTSGLCPSREQDVTWPTRRGPKSDTLLPSSLPCCLQRPSCRTHKTKSVEISNHPALHQKMFYCLCPSLPGSCLCTHGALSSDALFQEGLHYSLMGKVTWEPDGSAWFGAQFSFLFAPVSLWILLF